MNGNRFPHFSVGPIVKGFGRGSSELGCPTANFPLEVVQQLPDNIETGIYFGWANVDNGEVYKAVLSIGWNPFYENKEKSMETHILHPYNAKLYGKLLRVCICGYLRPEKNFDSLESLITAIKNDINDAETQLNLEQFFEFRSSAFFHAEDNPIETRDEVNKLKGNE